MMFNGLLMCNDCDTSDFTKDSTGESEGEDRARARSLEGSLRAAAMALKNKEETVRVQAESLALAEELLAAASRTRNCGTGCHFDVTDASTTTQLHDNRELVKTLQDNLSVVEELYRECFYESARQDAIIAGLRASCRERTRTSQDIALEVENLKAEISNFLNSTNSTNNDSGVWEAGGGCGGSGPGLELHGIEDQLRRLAAVLQADCTCGLMDENMKLKKVNSSMEMQMEDLRQRICDLKEALENKESLEQQYQKQIEEKEKELQNIKAQHSNLERDSRDQAIACDTLSCETKELEGLLNEKSEELFKVQGHCASQETTIKHLKEELEKANNIAKENASVRREVWSLATQVATWRRQLATDARRRHLAQHYAEKCAQAEELRSELREARAGGAALCARARGALRAARDGLRALADHARENEEIISQQEILIRSLREKSKKNISKTSSVSENEPCCSKYLHRVEMTSGERGFVDARETTRSKCSSSDLKERTGEREIADDRTPPTPPRRLLRKKPLCLDRRCQWPQVRAASVGWTPPDTPVSSVVNRELSSDYLLERVERTHEALELAHRRWCRHGHDHGHDRPAPCRDAH